ncbi:glycosyltransferase [Asanoa ferruginea]|uniref:glycosyltransferase n=1 Tax=Asanoa ferruginea TaxID=53367 RepID=UPI001944FD12|nr:glycosyltransferase [Asanoa ferruginea]
MVHPESLGPLLLDAGLVTPEQLAEAETSADRCGAPLGSVLVANGVLARRDLFRTLAAAWNCGYLDVSTEWLDPDLPRHDPAMLFRDAWLPLHHDDEGYVLVATSQEPTPERVAMIEAAVGVPVCVGVTTDWDLDEAIQRAYRPSPTPALSTSGGFNRAWLVIAVAVLALIFATGPAIAALVLLASAGYLLYAGFTFAVCLRGARAGRPVTAALDERDLPAYTVVVPLLDDADAVPDLIANLGAIDYPAAKLEIILLLAEDDHETIDAAHAAEPPATTKFVLVPAGAAATGVGLSFARGSHVVSYGAADRPEPDQLRKAAAALHHAGAGTVGVQAALDQLLPGLDDVPVRATSSHFRTDALRRLGGWDADLGVRVAAAGLRVGALDSTTFQPASVPRPRAPFRALGARRALGFLLLTGGPSAAVLLSPVLYLVFVAALLLPVHLLDGVLPGWVLGTALASLLGGVALTIYTSMMAAFHRRHYRLVARALLSPLHSSRRTADTYRALWQSLVRRSDGEKSTHGSRTVHSGDRSVATADLG